MNVLSPDFHIGPVSLHWYGLLLGAAIFFGYVLAIKFAPRFGIAVRLVEEFLPWLVVAGLLGARFYYVIFSWDYFREHLGEIWKFWHGGLSIYGAITGGVIASIWFTKIKKAPVWSFLDLLALVAPLGQAIGRLGNFFNQEAFGRPTALPWGIYILPDHRPFEFLGEKYFHPTFLYELLWDLCVLAILLYLGRRSANRARFSGRLTASYLVLYGLGRFFIESLRVDSFFVFHFRVDQLVSILAIIIGASIYFLISKKVETLPHHPD